jgi:hypothetical protein
MIFICNKIVLHGKTNLFIEINKLKCKFHSKLLIKLTESFSYKIRTIYWMLFGTFWWICFNGSSYWTIQKTPKFNLHGNCLPCA